MKRIMDANQLRELATNATLNHWPPHLGVVTEADKIQYLADRLREAGDDLGDRTDDCPQCSICEIHGGKENYELKVDAAEVIGTHKKLADALKNLRNANLAQVADYLDDLEFQLDQLEALALP